VAEGFQALVEEEEKIRGYCRVLRKAPIGTIGAREEQ
jgi:hypothetical protein